MTRHHHQLPDVAFVGYPPIETAAVILRWLKQKQIPTVIDVKDQWPSVFLEPFPARLRPLLSIGFSPYFYLGKRAMKDATSFCTMSKCYLDWMSSFAGRKLHSRDMVVPLVAPMIEVDQEDLKNAKSWWSSVGVDFASNRRISFVGSLSPAFDFQPIRDVAYRLKHEGLDYQFVICGNGSEREKIQNMMSGLENVIITSWIDLPKIKSLYDGSAALIAPYRKTDNFTQNIPNKIVDAFANGLPLVTSLDGEVNELIQQSGAGSYYNNTDELYSAVQQVLNNSNLQSEMKRNASQVYQSKFEFNSVYGKLANNLEKLASPRYL